jgi:pilus assembly protein TadC
MVMTGYGAALLGAGCGLGLLIVVRAFGRRPTSLHHLSRILSTTGRGLGAAGSSRHAPSPGASPPGARSPVHASVDGAGSDLRPDGVDMGTRAGRWAVGLMESFGLGDLALLQSRLRVLDKSIEQHAFEKLAAMVVGLCLPPAAWLILTTSGSSPPMLATAVASVVLAVGGFVYPDVPLAEQVEERRRSFRHGLGAYLELVSVLLAGGAGTQTALQSAADAGGGWAFAEIRRALDRAAATNRSASELFDELGMELGVDELRDLAASLALAGGHGARVKDSLVAKADAMRHTLSTDLEALAEARTERMIVPVAIMTVGLTAFVGYGAINAITSGSDVVDPGINTEVEP